MNTTDQVKAAAHQELGVITDNLLTAYNNGTLETTPGILLFALSHNRKRMDAELGKSTYKDLVDDARESSASLLYTPLKSGRPVPNAMLAARYVSGAFDLRPLYIDQYSVVAGEAEYPVIYKYAVDTKDNSTVLVRQNDKNADLFVLDTIYVKAPTSRVSVPGTKYNQRDFNSRFVMLDFNKPQRGMPTLRDINTTIDSLVGGNRIRPLS